MNRTIEGLSPAERHESMRGWFVYELHARMIENGKIWVVMGGVGYGVFDKIRRDFADRFVNTAAAEQAMIGVAVGLAIKDRVPFVYTITPFLLYRPFETIRNYINREGIPVILVGSGRDQDYGYDGFSHFAEEDRRVMALFPNIQSFWPETKEEVPQILDYILSSPRPTYLNLRR